MGMATRVYSRRLRLGLVAGMVLLMQSFFILHLEFSTRSLDVARRMTEDDSAVHVHMETEIVVGVGYERKSRNTSGDILVFIQDTPGSIFHEDGSTWRPQFYHHNRDEQSAVEGGLTESHKDVQDTERDGLKRRVALESKSKVNTENAETASRSVRKKILISAPLAARNVQAKSFNDTLTIKTFPFRSPQDKAMSRNFSGNSTYDSLSARLLQAHSLDSLFPKNTANNSAMPSNPHLAPDTAVSRLNLAENVCHSHASHIAGKVQKVYIYEAENVAYCSTHKIGSTFWIRIFRWLYNDTNEGHVASPLLISKFETHLLPLKKLKVHDINENLIDGKLSETTYRFLFTRDPYARLWSVYIDKFVLPDNFFWHFYAPRIKASVYGKGLQTSNSAPKSLTQKLSVAGKLADDRELQRLNRPRFAESLKSNPRYKNKFRSKTLQSPIQRPIRKCLNVTFHEFLQYIVNKAKNGTGMALDDHFRPVHYGCNPCQFQPDFIGHIETMMTDSTQVLRQMKLDHLLHELNSVNHVEHEIDMLITFNFYLVVRMKYQKACVSNKELERRLLKTFIYNGYVPADSETLLESKLPLGQTNFQKAILNLYRNSGITSRDIRKQREKYRIDAYRKIPRDLLVSIQKLFYWDFELFGYEPFPSELFDR